MVSLNLCNVLISNRSSVYLTGNNSLWSVIYPISTDMFMACTVKYTKPTASDMHFRVFGGKD